MKKSLKFSEIYIAYLPLIVFFLNLLYGLLNIEGVGGYILCAKSKK